MCLLDCYHSDLDLSLLHELIMELLLIILLVLILVGAFPTWPYSRNWGYGPVGAIITLVLILLILRIFGVL